MDAELDYASNLRAVKRLERELERARLDVVRSRLGLLRLRKEFQATWAEDENTSDVDINDDLSELDERDESENGKDE